MLRIRVVSSRTAAVDKLRKAVFKAVVAQKNSALASPSDNPGAVVGLSDDISSGASVSSTQSPHCVAHDQSAIRQPPSSDDVLVDAIANYLVARHQGSTPRIPTEILSALSRPSNSWSNDEMRGVISSITSIMIDSQPGGVRRIDLATSAGVNLTDMWSKASTPADVLDIYQSLMQILVVNKRGSHGSATTLQSLTGAAADAMRIVVTNIAAKVLVDDRDLRQEPALPSASMVNASEMAIGAAGDVGDDSASMPTPSPCVATTHKPAIDTVVLGRVNTSASISWSMDAEVTAIMRMLQQGTEGSDLLSLVAPGAAAPRLQPEASFIYSPDRGLLTLSPEMRDELKLSMVTLEVHASSECMGGNLSRWLMERLAGYDTAVLNSVIAATSGRGYVMAEHNGEVYALSHSTEVGNFTHSLAAVLVFKLGTLCSAVFLVFSSSSLVSFILAQTQQRMLRFTMALQHHVRSRLPLMPLVLAHLVDSLVFVPIMLGVLFFLFEFFVDQLLAFAVLVVVFVCELWSMTACRTVESIKVFPRVFGLLMTWFHVYYLSYPFGYQFLCLATTTFGLLCCLWHLWNRYEWPALECGHITSLQPRSPSVAGLLSLYGVPTGPAPATAAGGSSTAAGAGNADVRSGQGSSIASLLAAGRAVASAAGGSAQTPGNQGGFIARRPHSASDHVYSYGLHQALHDHHDGGSPMTATYRRGDALRGYSAPIRRTQAEQQQTAPPSPTLPAQPTSADSRHTAIYGTPARRAPQPSPKSTSMSSQQHGNDASHTSSSSSMAQPAATSKMSAASPRLPRIESRGGTSELDAVDADGDDDAGCGHHRDTYTASAGRGNDGNPAPHADNNGGPPNPPIISRVGSSSAVPLMHGSAADPMSSSAERPSPVTPLRVPSTHAADDAAAAATAAATAAAGTSPGAASPDASAVREQAARRRAHAGSSGSPLLEGLRAVGHLVRSTAEAALAEAAHAGSRALEVTGQAVHGSGQLLQDLDTDPYRVLATERHDRHDRLALGGWD